MRKSYLLLILFIIGISIVVADLPADCNSGTSGESCACATGKTHLPIEGDSNTHKCYTSTKVTNCQYGNPNYDTCYECANTHTFSTGKKCVTKKDYCIEYSDDGKCTKCDETHSLQANGAGCDPCSYGSDGRKCKKQYCITHNSNMECTKCNDGYKVKTDDGTCDACDADETSVDGSACFDKINDCANYQSDGNCVKCEDGKYLKYDSNAVGTVKTSCVDCDEGTEVQQEGYCFTKDANNCNGKGYKYPGGQCGSVENCILYDDAGTNCLKCNDHMEVKNNVCSPCYSPYETVGAFCLRASSDVIAHCKEYEDGTGSLSDKSVCKTCEDNYTLSKTENKCIPSSCTTPPTTPTPTPTPSPTQSPKGSGNADGSDGNMMRLNIIYMAIMLMIIV